MRGLGGWCRRSPPAPIWCTCRHWSAGVMEEAGVGFSGLGGVAASGGPGLIGGLIVGSQFAKGIAIAHGLPFVAVNHLEAHALTARLPGLVEGGAVPLPAAAGLRRTLPVRGGRGLGRYVRLGTTADDAVGEAFDKVAKMLGLGWPGGPALERLAAGGDAARYAFPRPMRGRPGCDFSFSGLKTAVAQVVAWPAGPAAGGGAADLAAAFQAAVADVMADRAAHAMAIFAAGTSWAVLVVAGGVARTGGPGGAGRGRRRPGFRLAAPPMRLCTDNAVMVAWAGLERLRPGLVEELDLAPRPRWPL